ncbi:glycosyltransferase family 4 protein [Glycomyces paridis]|nr:glycosyltransferase family 4 protein [Glycomyces paridis]
MEPTGRPRVVMLVDNTVDGDSRVQKAARAMADYGWDVHLIGRSTTPAPEEYALGAATVHRLPLEAVPARKSLLDRAMRLRFPLMYKNNGLADVVQRDVGISKTEEVQRSFAPGARARGVLPRPMRDLAGKVRRRFLQTRVRQTRAGFRWRGRRTHGRLQTFDAAMWKALAGNGAWRRLDPTPLRYDVTYGPLIEALRPALVHAHDYRMIGVGARAVARARSRGERVRLLYDAHEFVPGITNPAGSRWLASQTLYEREYFKCADAVVTVSEPLADLLVAEHGLAERPAVVLNTPPRTPSAAPAPGVRAACGLPAETPLAVYCGGAAEPRGLHTLVGTLALLPDLHVALVINTLDSPYVQGLVATAEAAGAADRLHLMGYVPYAELPAFLASADVGVHPLRRGPVNHEVALSTKFFEFLQARIPVVVSDVRAMSEAVADMGIGESFASEDTADLARALTAVLVAPETYRKPYTDPDLLDRYTWEAQAEHYETLYHRLLD